MSHVTEPTDLPASSAPGTRAPLTQELVAHESD